MFDVLGMYSYPVPKSTGQLKRNLKYSVSIIVALSMSLVSDFSAAPSMFGRDLGEQVRADSKDVERQVPVLVEKCIQAVEIRGWSCLLMKIRRTHCQINSTGL
jgi:hypothetical protein